jgi:hypothetical protein
MAATTGLVHALWVASPSHACASVGPTPSNTELLVVDNDGTASGVAFAGSLIQALAAAATNYRAVTVHHDDDQPFITSIIIDPV